MVILFWQSYLINHMVSILIISPKKINYLYIYHIIPSYGRNNTRMRRFSRISCDNVNRTQVMVNVQFIDVNIPHSWKFEQDSYLLYWSLLSQVRCHKICVFVTRIQVCFTVSYHSIEVSCLKSCYQIVKFPYLVINVNTFAVCLSLLIHLNPV